MCLLNRAYVHVAGQHGIYDVASHARGKHSKLGGAEEERKLELHDSAERSVHQRRSRSNPRRNDLG